MVTLEQFGDCPDEDSVVTVVARIEVLGRVGKELRLLVTDFLS